MKHIERGFNPMTDRYAFDFRRCTYENGWAQLDTSQDASYYGQWINPEKRQIIQYVEGDIYTITLDTDEELVAEVAGIKAWNEQQGHRYLGIDPGFDEAFTAKLIKAGLGPYFHDPVVA